MAISSGQGLPCDLLARSGAGRPLIGDRLLAHEESGDVLVVPAQSAPRLKDARDTVKDVEPEAGEAGAAGDR